MSLKNSHVFVVYFATILVLFTSTSAMCQYNAVIISNETNIKIENNKQIEDHSVLILIKDKESAWISDVSIPYRSTESIKITEAAIYDINGNLLRKLKGNEISTISDVSSTSFFEERFMKVFSLKWNTYPYSIKYSYRIQRNEFMYVANWIPLKYSTIAVSKATLNVKLPKNYKTRIKYSDELKFTSDTSNVINLKWEIERVPGVYFQQFAPPFEEILPSVKVVPVNFKYGKKGSFESWESYGSWQYRLNEGLDEIPESDILLIHRVIVDYDTRKDKIKALYHYLQDNTRYINITLGIGGLKPFSAEYTSNNNYGDCKALTIYMKALLKFLEIESFYSMVYAGDSPQKIDLSTPSQQFNHVILCVPLEKDTLWFENTSSSSPSNYLGTFTQNRYAFIVKDSSSTLVKTPALTLDDVLEESIYDIQLDIEGNGTATLYGKYRGGIFEKLIGFYREGTINEQKDEIDNILSISNYEITDYDFHQNGREESCVDLSISLNISNQVRKIGNNILYREIPIGIQKFEPVNSRLYPVRIIYPINKNYILNYDLQNTELFDIVLPDNIEIKSKYGYYAEFYNLVSGKIILEKSFQLYSNEYSLEEYGNFYKFIQSVTEAEKRSSILLKHK